MHFRFVYIAGLFVLATSGCFFHGGYPNGYYGPGPSVVPQQPSTGYPSGPFYQPGGTYSAPLNSGPTYVPGNSPGTGGPTPIFTPTTPPSSNPTYEPPSSSSPGFNESPNRSVPLPVDEDSGTERGTQRPQLSPTSALDEPDETPFTQTESRRLRQSNYEETNSYNAYVEEADQFQQPTVRQTSSVDIDDTEIQFANAPTRTRVNPYGHDPEFNWVQGTVSYDDESQSWSIIYDDHPKATDQLGGDLTLAGHPMLARLRTGDVVRIEGSLDETELDSREKPVYRVTRFKKL